MDTLIAVLAALGAAASFGVAGVLQHRATQRAPRRPPLRPQLLLDLVRMHAFRSGVLFGGLGFALQVVALRFGPLALVQPLLVTGMLFYIALASVLNRRRPDGLLVIGALCAMAGLTGFLLVAEPSGAGDVSLERSALLPLGASLVVVVAVCLAIASRTRSEIRALPLAAATAVFYGVTAALVRSLESASLLGPDTVFGHWQLYAIAVLGPAGFLLNQNAFQSGLLGAAAAATITVGDPVVAIGVGAVWLGESISGGAWAVTGEAVAMAVMAGGVLLLAERSQHVAAELEARQAGHTDQPG